MYGCVSVECWSIIEKQQEQSHLSCPSTNDHS